MKKASQAIAYEKVREVLMFMNNVSKQPKEIIHFFSKKWEEDGYFTTKDPKSKMRHIYIYIQKVNNTYFNYENDVNVEKGRSLARLDELYQKMVKIQDYKGALTVLKEINDMLGLKAPEKYQTTLIKPLEYKIID